MKAVFFAYSRQGMKTALAAAACFPDMDRQFYAPAGYCAEHDSGGDAVRFLPIPQPSAAFYGALFGASDVMVFIGALGIAVRSIAPHVRDKRSDPAVLCMDELGRFAISVLSGHIGGANQLANQLAQGMHAQPVITTATDINGRFSVDTWAREQGFLIDDMKAARDISAAILERDIPLYSDCRVEGPLPPGVFSADTGDLGICISWARRSPFRRTLRLIPPIVRLGIGCRRDIPLDHIEAAVEAALNQAGIDPRAVKGVYSIDLKAHEPALVRYCEEHGWPLTVYSAKQLSRVSGEFSGSGFVQSITGVDNVCERAALLDADRLILRKTAKNGVTAAAAVEERIIRFAAGTDTDRKGSDSEQTISMEQAANRP